MRKVVIVDIDGTTLDSSHRKKRLEGKPWPATREAWAEWEEGMENDPPIQIAIDLVRMFMRTADLEIVFVTAREEYMRSRTTTSLKRHFHPDSFTMWMRADGDRRASAAEVKLELVIKHVGVENVYCCMEDEIGVARAFRAAGMYVLHVADPVEA